MSKPIILCLIGLLHSTICAKHLLETWFSPNDDIRKCLLDMKGGSNKNAFWDVNTKKWRKWCTFVSPFLFNNTYVLSVITTGTKCTNKVFYVWLVDLQTICAKYGQETWFSPNDDIRKYLLDKKHCSNKNAFWYVNKKKWRKWCKFLSPFLFNNTYGLLMLTMETKCPNQIFYDWLVVNRPWKRESLQVIIFVYVCSSWSIVELKTRFEIWITWNHVIDVRFLTFLI
jgi:hypothetical protein